MFARVPWQIGKYFAETFRGKTQAQPAHGVTLSHFEKHSRTLLKSRTCTPPPGPPAVALSTLLSLPEMYFGRILSNTSGCPMHLS